MVPPTPTNAMRVFIVSRNELLIKEVSAILESENHFIVEETHDPEDGVSQAVKSLQPDIILYDYQYSPLEETFDTIDDITILHPNVATIVIIPNEEVANANRVILKVQDDGQGFDTQNQNLRLGRGLANMQSRAESLGGLFDIRSTPGAGTTVILDLPREPQASTSM